jgi:glucuronate isomerase
MPARCDVWRRVVCDWLAGLVTTGVVDDEEACGMAWDLDYGQAKSTYRFGEIA